MKTLRTKLYLSTVATVLFLFFSGIASAQTVSKDAAAKIDEYMNAGVKYARYNSAVMVAEAGKPIVARGYGMANFEDETPITPQTKFRVGSVTKQFTSMAIMMLQEKGKLNTEDKICKYLSDCPAAWADITIHNLLTHTSGIHNYTALPSFVPLMPEPTTPAKLIGLVKGMPLDFRPGEKYSYSNSGYIVLGAIIEQVSGKSYKAFLQENIFTPLGMTGTGYDEATPVIKHRAAGYSHQGSTIVNTRYIDMTIPFSAGAIYSTVEDLLIWDQALYTEKLVSQKSLDAIFTPFKSNYAYGWTVTEQFGHKLISHNGGVNGFSAHISRFTSDKITIIVLSNFDDGRATKIATDLAAIVFGQQYEIPQERKEVKLDPKILAGYAGVYQIAPAFSITIIVEGDRIYAQATGQNRFEIAPQSDTKFFARAVDIDISFFKDDKGETSHLIIHQAGRETKATRVKQ